MSAPVLRSHPIDGQTRIDILANLERWLDAEGVIAPLDHEDVSIELDLSPSAGGLGLAMVTVTWRSGAVATAILDLGVAYNPGLWPWSWLREPLGVTP